MTYTKPQVLNVQKASTAIKGASKPLAEHDNRTNTSGSTPGAYRSDEE